MKYALDAVLTIGLISAWYFGLVGLLWEHDHYWLCTTISTIGFGYYVLGHWTIEHSRLGTETVFTLGLFGTIFGFTSMVLADGDIYSKLPGALTAFMTTLTGIVWGLSLRYQAWLQGDRS